MQEKSILSSLMSQNGNRAPASPLLSSDDSQLLRYTPSHSSLEDSHETNSVGRVPTGSEDGEDLCEPPFARKKKRENDSSLSSSSSQKNFHTTYKKANKEEVIVDSYGVYSYNNNPTEYMRARKRQQNRESATRTRTRKAVYTKELEEELQRVYEQNEQLRIQNASLTTENEMLKKQVEYFQNVVAGQNAAKPLDEFVLHDLPREEDRPISSDDGDFIFYGATNGNDNLLSTNSFFLTLVFGLLCLVSFTFSSETGSDSTGVSTERGLKSLYSGEGILWKLKNWVLNPYLLLATYIIIMGIMIFRRDRGFLSSKSKQWIRRIKSHSKTN